MKKTPERRDRDGAALVGLTLLMLAVNFLAYSRAAVPLIDDWTYAWSVVHFLQTGALRMLAWGGLVAFYLTLREMGIRPLPASLGTVVLLCNPVLFMLSHSFMTDVPFVSVMNGSLLCYVRWTKRGHTHDLALGSALAVVAFLIRQLGAALALAPIGYVLLMRLVGGPRRILTWPQRLCLLMPFVGLGLTLGWIRGVHGER